MAVTTGSGRLAGVIVAAVLLVGCGSSTSSTGTTSSGTTGTLTGRALNYGGPMMPNGSMAANGVPAGGVKVMVFSGGKQVASAMTGADGTFSFTLPPGNYALSGCQTASVSVTAGTRTTHDLTCAVP
jgi:hypothetical protein